MKVEPECYICLLERALRISQMLSDDKVKIIEVMKRISELLIREFTPGSVPAILGTKRERIIAETLGIEDPYNMLKEKSNRIAAKVAQKIFSEVDMENTSYDNFRRIMFLAAAANATEWFIKGHEFSLETFETELKEAMGKVAIDDSIELYHLIKDKRNILYILDNAGEAVIDLWVIKYLRKFSGRIVVGARASPVLNDITVEEAGMLGFREVADVLVPVGEFVGVVLEQATDEFRREIRRAEIIIAKGMGAYETLTEYRLDTPTFIILKAKCKPVARSLGVNQGELVIKKLF